MNDETQRIDRVLRDLLAFSDLAARLVARGTPAYDRDEALRLAAEAILHKIGVAVGKSTTRSSGTRCPVDFPARWT